jgi:hypothetical protein
MCDCPQLMSRCVWLHSQLPTDAAP